MEQRSATTENLDSPESLIFRKLAGTVTFMKEQGESLIQIPMYEGESVNSQETLERAKKHLFVMAHPRTMDNPFGWIFNEHLEEAQRIFQPVLNQDLKIK